MKKHWDLIFDKLPKTILKYEIMELIVLNSINRNSTYYCNVFLILCNLQLPSASFTYLLYISLSINVSESCMPKSMAYYYQEVWHHPLILTFTSSNVCSKQISLLLYSMYFLEPILGSVDNVLLVTRTWDHQSTFPQILVIFGNKFGLFTIIIVNWLIFVGI